jgi:hypothetical protein
MHQSDRDRTSARLEGVVARLRGERATATPLELDRIKLQAMRQAGRPRPGFYARQKGMLMKSRLALMALVAAGLMLSTTGATLAITGSSGSGSASQNQYQSVAPATEEGGEPAPATEEGGEPQSRTLGGANESGPEVQAAATEQVAATGSGSSLPFTGYLAIPLLVVGVGLLSLGMVLRWKAGRHGDSAA